MKNLSITQEAETTSSSLSQPQKVIQTDWKARFTATGRPMPEQKKRSAWESAALWGVQAPTLPPFRFTDDSIIMVIVKLPSGSHKAEQGMMKKLLRLGQDIRCWTMGIKGPGSPMKLVRMPRAEYLKHFARSFDNTYVGTEPERQWTEEELDSTFSIYNNAPSAKWIVRDLGDDVFMEETSNPDFCTARLRNQENGFLSLRSS